MVGVVHHLTRRYAYTVGMTIMKKLKPNINYGEFHKIRNSGGLYVLALVGAGEFFLKVGISSNVNSRLYDLAKHCKYRYKFYILNLIELERTSATLLETKCMVSTTGFGFKPRYFTNNGFTECRKATKDTLSRLNALEVVSEAKIEQLREIYKLHSINRFETEYKTFKYEPRS